MMVENENTLINEMYDPSTDILMQIVQRKHMHTFLRTLWELSINVNAMKSYCTHRQGPQL